METQIQERMAYYIALYNELRRKVADVQVQTAIMNQVGKDTRMAQIRAWSGSNDKTQANGDQPATAKQVAFLKDLGVAVPTGITKQRASEMIDEAQNV